LADVSGGAIGHGPHENGGPSGAAGLTGLSPKTQLSGILCGPAEGSEPRTGAQTLVRAREGDGRLHP